MSISDCTRWVFSSELPSSETSGHSVYKPSSNSSKMNGYSWSISYGDGSSASGDVYKDTVGLAGISAPQQAVEAASKISAQFSQNSNNDGLLGLAFSSINTGKLSFVSPGPSPSIGRVLTSPSSQAQASDHLV